MQDWDPAGIEFESPGFDATFVEEAEESYMDVETLATLSSVDPFFDDKRTASSRVKVPSEFLKGNKKLQGLPCELIVTDSEILFDFGVAVFEFKNEAGWERVKKTLYLSPSMEGAFNSWGQKNFGKLFKMDPKTASRRRYVASTIDEFLAAGFSRRGDSHLIRKSETDLWSLKSTEAGYVIERLFEGEGPVDG